ncbi:MAG: phage major capsid protein [Tepidiformaceae bacterium]
MIIRELIERRSNAWERMKVLNAASESRDLTSDEDQEYRRLEKTVEQDSGEIDRRQRFGSASTVFEAMPGDAASDQIRGRAIMAGNAPGNDVAESRVTGQESILRPEQRMTDWLEARGELGPWASEGLSLGLTLRGMATGDWRNAQAERRALSESQDTLGGYLLSAPMASFVIDNLRADAIVFQAGANTVPMVTEELAVATIDSDPAATWRAELSTITPDEGPNIGRITLRAKSLISDVIVSRELVQDAPNIGQILENTLRKVLALKLDYAALAGQGAAAEPLGLKQLTTADGITIIGADSDATDGGAFAFDDVHDAIEGILSANAPMPTAMLMAPRTRVFMAKMKDGEGLPVVLPDLIKDLKILTSTQIAIDETQGSSSTATRVYLGDFRELMVGIRQNILIEATPYATGAYEKHAVIFRCHLRADVAPAHAKSFAMLKGITS